MIMDWMEYTILTTTEGSELISQVLEDAGVYKRTAEGKAAFERFIRSL